ncbi:MAG: alginate export family protein [Verrucomicrobia bacterium]|nr:alginate export family protein [Verrucomicrobiota bacterium]
MALLAAAPVAEAGDAKGATTNAVVVARAPVSAGLLNDWMRKQSEEMRAWDIGGEVRVRYANSEKAVPSASSMTATSSGTKTTPINPNTDFIGRGQPNNNDELLFREKFHAGYTPVSWFTVYGEFRNSTEEWDQRYPSPDEDTTDLQQAYVEFGDPREVPIMAKFGRQTLNYGDRRFVADPPWNNTGRVFDAAKLCFVTDAFWVDAFCGRMVVPRQDHVNVSNDYDYFSGIYASSQKLMPWQETQVYFLSRNAGAQAVSASDLNVPGTPTTARDIYTAGIRFKSLSGKLGGWDYSLEAAGQCGSCYNTTLKKRLDQQAYAVFASGGYTWTNVWATPRLGVGYEGGSGDSNPNDGKSETFENLFGSSHGFYGQMDLFCQRNMHIPHITASVKPLKDLTVMLDCMGFWLADTNDYLYPESGSGRNANGYDRHPTYDSYVGTEVDLVARYSPLSWLKLETGYGHFFVGTYIKQSVSSPTYVAANGSAMDANWFYVQTTISF